MAFTGMNIESVRGMATQMDQASAEIEELVSRLTNTLAGVDWQGPDATMFRSEWEGPHTASLRHVSQALQAVATTARRNADEQQTTSSS